MTGGPSSPGDDRMPGKAARDMQVDVMLTPQPLPRMSPTARAIEDAGLDGILFTEGARTAYLAAAVAAVAAPSLELSTGVAVAFPRARR